MKKLFLFCFKNPKKCVQLFYKSIIYFISFTVAVFILFIIYILVLILIPFELLNKKIKSFKKDS